MVEGRAGVSRLPPARPGLCAPCRPRPARPATTVCSPAPVSGAPCQQGWSATQQAVVGTPPRAGSARGCGPPAAGFHPRGAASPRPARGAVWRGVRGAPGVRGRFPRSLRRPPHVRPAPRTPAARPSRRLLAARRRGYALRGAARSAATCRPARALAPLSLRARSTRERLGAAPPRGAPRVARMCRGVPPPPPTPRPPTGGSTPTAAHSRQPPCARDRSAPRAARTACRMRPWISGG